MGDMTRLLLLLLLWVGVSVSTPVDLEKRIIGGDKCKDDERQYHVKFEDKNNELICGGSLISEKWILTAAHCWKRDMKPVLGLHPDPSKKQTGEILTKRAFQHLSDKHDIMLLELRSSITTIKPVKLPDCKNSPARGAKVQIAGHGPISPPGQKRGTVESPTLQCVELEIVGDPKSECNYKLIKREEYGKTHFRYYKSAGKDTSGGDSGGGVVYNGMIYGVHSHTLNPTHGCVAAAGFVDVCEYKTWIEKTTGLKFP